MYATSAAYKTAIEAAARVTRITGTITLADSTVLNITDADIKANSLHISEYATESEGIDIGSVNAAEMGLQVYDTTHDFTKAVIALEFGIDIGAGVYEDVPLGVFYVPAGGWRRSSGVVDIKAADGMLLLEADVGSPWGAGYAKHYLMNACDASGVTLATPAAVIDAMPNGDVVLIYRYGKETKTCRDLVMWVAQLLGAFACFNRDGQLEIRPYSGTSVRTIGADIRYNTDMSGVYNGPEKIIAGNVSATASGAPANPITMTIAVNPLLAASDPPDRLQEIVDYTDDIQYQMFGTEFIGDPSLELGDYITLTGGVAGAGKTGPILYNYWAYRGKQTIASVNGEGLEYVSQNQADKLLGTKIDAGDVAPFPMANSRQDNTTNNAVSNQSVKTGWGWIQGNGSGRSLSESVTFDEAFDDVPVVLAQATSARNDTDPASLDELNSTSPQTFAKAQSITSSGFTVTVSRASPDGNDPGVLATAARYGYVWIAIGTKAR